MPKYSLLFLLSFIFLVNAQDPDRFEIGVMLGEPTGLSAKYWLSRNNAVDAAAGWSFTNRVVDAAVDYQRHFYLFDVQQGLLPLYLGLGVGLQLGSRGEGDDSFLGARIPVGGTYLFERAPISLFAEIAPVIEIIPETRARLSGGVGARFRIGELRD